MSITSNQSYYGNTVYSSTDTLTNLIYVNVNGNIITVLNDEYVLPNPVLFKQPTNLPNTLIYVTSMLNGLIQNAIQVSASINQLDEVVVIVSELNYYYLQGPLTFNALSVTLNSNNTMSAVLDPNSINQSQYVGNSFSLFGNVLTGVINLSPTNSATTVSTTSSGTTGTTSGTSSTSTSSTSS